jgi:polyhydroxybutyrate depolymerase
MIRVLITALALFATQATAQTKPDSILPGSPCHGQTACDLDGRSYNVKEPDGWDGVTPLPVLLHFHGWARTGALPVNHGRISGATRRRGVLLLAPTGINKTWNFRRDGSEDVAFANAVIADAASRYPIDRDQIFVSGYSYGGLMAWRYACESGDSVKAVMSISATLATSGHCDQQPREFREVYGLKDNVLDFPYGPDGDTTFPVIFWRAQYGCPEIATQTNYTITGNRDFVRSVWDCAGNTVTLDIHPGGHLIPRGWIGRQLDDLLDRATTYP